MTAERIVSLVPSLTELVAWLGAGERLVGRTKFCTEPPGLAQSVPALGGTKNPDLARIIRLAPDLVIANREENRREDIEALRAAGLEVLLTHPDTVDEALEMIEELGRLLGVAGSSADLARDIEAALAPSPPDPLSRLVPHGRGGASRVYVGVWHNPMMGLGSGTYGDSVLEACGGENVLADQQRYPELTMAELRALKPQLILLPDEPFPFDASHAALYGEVAPARVVDGKLLWWYGPRIPEAIRTLRAILREAAR